MPILLLMSELGLVGSWALPFLPEMLPEDGERLKPRLRAPAGATKSACADYSQALLAVEADTLRTLRCHYAYVSLLQLCLAVNC